MSVAIKKSYAGTAVVLALLTAVGGGYVFCSVPAHSAATPPKRELVLNVIPLKPQDVTVTTTHVGYVTPIKSVELVPNVSGYIADVLVEGGQKVKAGDNLVLIDQRRYKAELNAAVAAVTQAQADFNNAKVYYERIQKAGGKAVSQSEADSAKARYLSALGSLEEARANQAKAQVMYDYTVLQSSIDGIVGWCFRLPTKNILMRWPAGAVKNCLPAKKFVCVWPTAIFISRRESSNILPTRWIRPPDQ